MCKFELGKNTYIAEQQILKKFKHLQYKGKFFKQVDIQNVLHLIF